MSFVLDNSMIMRWFFGDGKPSELAYAGKVPDAMKNASALVPPTWGLAVVNVIAKAEAKALVTEARSRAFLEMLEGVEIVKWTRPHSHIRCLIPCNWRGAINYPLTMRPISNWP